MLNVLGALRRMAHSLADRHRFRLRFYHQTSDLTPGSAVTQVPPVTQDEGLVRRLIAAYRLALRTDSPDGDSMWHEFFERMHRDIHVAIVEGDVATLSSMLRDPRECNLLYGFDGISKAHDREEMTNPMRYMYGAKLTLDGLARLAEAVNARRLTNLETPAPGPARLDADILLAELDAAFGFPIEIPNPFPHEHGIGSSRGVISWRVPQALYQAWQIAQLVAGIPNPRVLEIGGGMGRTAFYARKFGILDYSIVDIPMTGLAQGYFLERTLGEGSVLLFGEQSQDSDTRLKLMPPSAFMEGNDRYDLIVNADSLTEIDRGAALAYMKEIPVRTNTFLSINHEANPFTVRDLAIECEIDDDLDRMPCWLREGYVQETWRPYCAATNRG